MTRETAAINLGRGGNAAAERPAPEARTGTSTCSPRTMYALC